LYSNSLSHPLLAAATEGVAAKAGFAALLPSVLDRAFKGEL